MRRGNISEHTCVRGLCYSMHKIYDHFMKYDALFLIKKAQNKLLEFPLLCPVTALKCNNETDQ